MPDWIKDQGKKGWLTSIFELGAWFGCLYSGFLAETLSRKYSIMLNTVIFVIGIVVQCMAVTAGASAMLGGRFVTGMFLTLWRSQSSADMSKDWPLAPCL